MIKTINQKMLLSILPFSPHGEGRYASGNYQGHRPREPDPWLLHTIIFYQWISIMLPALYARIGFIHKKIKRKK